jgi:hypothetical protein
MAVSDIASYVTNQYRPVLMTDQGTLDETPTAEYLTIDTNLDGQGGIALATELLNDYKRSTATYSTLIEGIDGFGLSDFNGRPPMVEAHLGNFTVRTQRVQSVSIDLNTFQTTVVSRG